jgi:hypothetical protein
MGNFHRNLFMISHICSTEHRGSSAVLKQSFWNSELRLYRKAFSESAERKPLDLRIAGLNIEMWMIHLVISCQTFFHLESILSLHYDIKSPE